MVKTTLLESYSFPGYRAVRTLIDADYLDARIVVLDRRQKKAFALTAHLSSRQNMIQRFGQSAICRVANTMCIFDLSTIELNAASAA
jgi:hypothetical protein